MTTLELEDKLIEANAAIESLRTQLANERAGLTDRIASDPSWAAKASYALQCRLEEAGRLRRDLQNLREAEARDRRQARNATKQENIARARQQAMEAGQRRRDRQERHARATAEANAAALKAVKAHVKTLPEDIRQGFYDVINRAERAAHEARSV